MISLRQIMVWARIFSVEWLSLDWRAAKYVWVNIGFKVTSIWRSQKSVLFLKIWRPSAHNGFHWSSKSDQAIPDNSTHLLQAITRPRAKAAYCDKIRYSWNTVFIRLSDQVSYKVSNVRIAQPKTLISGFHNRSFHNLCTFLPAKTADWTSYSRPEFLSSLKASMRSE